MAASPLPYSLLDRKQLSPLTYKPTLTSSYNFQKPSDVPNPNIQTTDGAIDSLPKDSNLFPIISDSLTLDSPQLLQHLVATPQSNLDQSPNQPFPNSLLGPEPAV